MAAANLIIPTNGRPITDIDKDSEETAICDHVEGCTISTEISKEEELHSRGQVDNKLWHDLHVGRITSSAFHDVVVRCIMTSPTVLFKRFMGYSKPVQTFVMKRGICTEAAAIKSYVNYMTFKGHIGLTLTSCELTLCTQASYIGASILS